MTISITKSSRIAALAVGAGLVLAVAFGGFAAPAYALTQAEATTIIQVLGLTGSQAAAIQALVSGGSSTTSLCTFTGPLTIGATGPQVTCLQENLISMGFSIPAGATGYFGTQTRGAVAAWQASKNIVPPAGYFGPISQQAWATSGGGTTGGGTTGGGTTGGTLSGGAGSIESYNEITSLSNEEVGEDEEDVEIGGLEIEVDQGSDIELTAVKIDFSTQPGNDNLDDFVTEVSIWLDGEEVARMDADEFTDDNDWTRTVTLESGAIIREGETGDLTVAVSGVGNIDSADAGDDWGLDFISVRFRDAQGASVTDTTSTDAFAWDVNTFASATDLELTATLDDNTPEGVVNIDDTNDTDGVELLRFTLEADGGDITINDLPINFATSSSNTSANADQTLAEIASTVYVTIDGTEFSESASGAQVAQGSAGATVTFDDIDMVISEGDEVTVIVSADINDTTASVFTDGDKLTAAFTASNRNSLDAEDETNEDLSDDDKTGTATGNALAFYDVGIMVTFVSADESVNASDGADNDSGVFTIKYRVEAFDGTVYVSDSAQATTDNGEDGIEETALDTAAGGVVYLLDEAGTPTVADISAQVTFSDVTGDPTDSAITNGVQIEEGEVAEFTLTVTRNNSGDSSDDGLFRVLLDAIGWATSDTSTLQVYDFDLEDFKTDPTNLN